MKYFTLKFYGGPLNGDSIMERIEEPQVGVVIYYGYQTNAGRRVAPYRVAAIKGSEVKLLHVNR
jgi:hypothetical protein